MPRYLPALGTSAAVHTGVVLMLVWPAVHPAVQAGAPSVLPVFVVPAPEDPVYAGLNPMDPAGRDWSQTGGVSGTIPSAELDKIAAHASVLFPFLTPGLALDAFFPIEALAPYQGGLRNPLAPVRRDTPRRRKPPALALEDAQMQEIVDSAWSRRDRWTAFEPVRVLAQTYAADDGRLPELLKAYREQNALQPYMDADIRDPRLWVQLNLAADHVTFIRFVRHYVAEHQGTRASIELLLLLDTIAEANGDALLLLLDRDPEKDLAWTRASSPRGYALVVELRARYEKALAGLGLTSPTSVRTHYDRVRLSILRAAIRTAPDGYRAMDARFAIGAILWRQDRRQEAMDEWRGLTVVEGNTYAAATEEVLAVLHSDGPAREISRALRNQEGRWRSFSFDRLRQFGYRSDTY